MAFELQDGAEALQADWARRMPRLVVSCQATLVDKSLVAEIALVVRGGQAWRRVWMEQRENVGSHSLLRVSILLMSLQSLVGSKKAVARAANEVTAVIGVLDKKHLGAELAAAEADSIGAHPTASHGQPAMIVG
jgi:hypothetical protein